MISVSDSLVGGLSGSAPHPCPLPRGGEHAGILAYSGLIPQRAICRLYERRISVIVQRTFGHIPGYPEDSCFGTRVALSQAGLHRPLVAGISGTGRSGANSVVLAGGYEDTEDFGDAILYTGHGGRDPETGRQIAHQTLTRGNLALACNKPSGLPVRVIRGARQHSPYAPEAGYRYDGLYSVDDYWREVGKAGFYIWRFRLVKIVEASPQGAPVTHS